MNAAVTNTPFPSPSPYPFPMQYSMHMRLADECLDKFSQRHLADIGEVEQVFPPSLPSPHPFSYAFRSLPSPLPPFPLYSLFCSSFSCPSFPVSPFPLSLPTLPSPFLVAEKKANKKDLACGVEANGMKTSTGSAKKRAKNLWSTYPNMPFVFPPSFLFSISSLQTN